MGLGVAAELAVEESEMTVEVLNTAHMANSIIKSTKDC